MTAPNANAVSASLPDHNSQTAAPSHVASTPIRAHQKIQSVSDLAAMTVGVVVGGTIASPYTKTMHAAEVCAGALGERWAAVNKRLNAAGDVVRYKLAQAAAGSSNSPAMAGGVGFKARLIVLAENAAD